MTLDQDKLKIIYNTLKEFDVDSWVIVGRETDMNSEPILPVLGDVEFIIDTAFIFTKEGKMSALVSPLDYEAYIRMEGIDEVVAYETLKQGFTDFFKENRAPKMALNFSENDPASDGLSLGLYNMLKEAMKEADYHPEIISSYPVVNKVRGIKTPAQIEKITHAAQEAQKIFEAAADFIKKGTTSVDISNFFHDKTAEIGAQTSWTYSQCPGVFVGPNSPIGHMAPVEIEVEGGMLINVDYGVKIDGYCSDNQRMYYVLKDGETDAPQEVKDLFNINKTAIQKAFEAMKPGITGFEVDKIARDYIVANGQKDYNHALGHQVGHACHDGGTLLANRRKRYNRPELIDTPIDAGNVFTLEPSFMTPYGNVGIEEMVVVTENGCEPIIPFQEELFLIKL